MLQGTWRDVSQNVKTNLPLQDTPLPVKPTLQEHVKAPGALVHVACE